MLFSIIIPVYNVEKYIRECVDSILLQDFGDYEVILVDDGSTDNSGGICDVYSLENKNISVIHKVNGGLSSARNAGVDLAKGQYILFIDSDDKIQKGSLQAIANTIKENCQPDVVFLEAIKFYPNGKIEPMRDGYSKERINYCSHTDVLQFISSMSKYPGSACTKAVKRIVFSGDMEFTVGLYSEDIEWTYRLFAKAKTYAYCSEGYYWYRQTREGSITYSVSEEKIESILHIVEKWAVSQPLDIMQKIINSYVAYQYMILLYNVACLDTGNSEKIKKLYERTRNLKWILKFGQSKKCKLVYCCCKFLGVKTTAKLLRRYKKTANLKFNL